MNADLRTRRLVVLLFSLGAWLPCAACRVVEPGRLSLAPAAAPATAATAAGPASIRLSDQAGLDPRPELKTRTLWAAASPAARQATDERRVQPVAYQQPLEDSPAGPASASPTSVQWNAPGGETVLHSDCDPAAPCFDGCPPQGVMCPYPPPAFAADEYLCDGGDMLARVVVDPDYTVRGIDPTDTVGHFDTRNGRTQVFASNRVCIYAPRFAAVRKIDGAVQNDYSLSLANANELTRVRIEEHNYIPTTNVQPLEPQRNVGLRSANAFRDRLPGAPLDNAEMLLAVRWGTPPYENLRMIREGLADASEALRLEEFLQAAINWQENKAVQVTLDKQPAVESSAPRTPGETKIYELPPGKSRLRIVKVASAKSAQPGDFVDFTIRFDNVGDQEIQNVVILDHLTTRLEYVEDSQECTLEARFLSDVQVDTLVLRWEIDQPLQVGEGGVIKFRCKVR